MRDADCDVRCESVSFKLLLEVGVAAESEAGAEDLDGTKEPVAVSAIEFVKTVEAPVSLPPSP